MEPNQDNSGTVLLDMSFILLMALLILLTNTDIKDYLGLNVRKSLVDQVTLSTDFHIVSVFIDVDSTCKYAYNGRYFDKGSDTFVAEISKNATPADLIVAFEIGERVAFEDVLELTDLLKGNGFDIAKFHEIVEH